MCALLLFTGELGRLSLPSPIALETLLAAGRNVGAVLPVPVHLLLLWLETVFQAGNQARKASTTTLEPSAGIPHGAGRSSAHSTAAPSGSTSPCPWLLLYPCEHHTAMPGDMGPSHKSQVVPGDLHVHVVLSGLTAGALAKQAGGGGCSTACVLFSLQHLQDF